MEGKEVAVRDLLDRWDRDGDRCLNFGEFRAAFGLSIDEASRRFAELDQDHDGKLDAKELRRAVKPTEADYRLAASLDGLRS
ncbi:EF hand [compost metagenome]